MAKVISKKAHDMLKADIKKARQEYENGETISCSTPEEMQRYFDSLWRYWIMNSEPTVTDRREEVPMTNENK